jgi:hypothetical protein
MRYTCHLCGRRVEGTYRKYALEATRQSIIGYKSWQQASRDFRDNLRAEGITGFGDAAGREWNMKTYADMVARTTTMEAHLAGTSNRLLEHGHDLVKVSSHAGSCGKCLPWQGKVLSLTGTTEGYPTLEKAREAGLFHPRCRHAYSLHLDIDAEIEQLERELGSERSPEYPGGPGARVDPELIRSKHPVEQVLATIMASDWASRKAFRRECGEYGRDWVRETGIALTPAQYDELQTLVIQDPKTDVFYYIHRTAGAQVAL